MGGQPDYVEQIFAKYATDDGRLERKRYSDFVRNTEGGPKTVDRHRWEHDCKSLGCAPTDGMDLSAFRKLYEYSPGYTGPTLHIGRAKEDWLGEPAKHVFATITLDADFEDLTGEPGSDARKSFLHSFTQDVATVLSSVSNSAVSTAELTIMHIAGPSVVVDLDIAPDSMDGACVSPANVAVAFHDAVYLPTLRVSTKPGVSVQRHDPHARLKAIFARADRNNDGVLTRGELAARLIEDIELAALLRLPEAVSMSTGALRAKMFGAIFKEMDSNEDKRIDESEFVRYFSKDFTRARLEEQVATLQLLPNSSEPDLVPTSKLEPVAKTIATTSVDSRETGRSASRSHPPPHATPLRWPPELSELVTVPQVAACLSEIGLGCLNDCAFLE
jgi:hypothetical protein